MRKLLPLLFLNAALYGNAQSLKEHIPAAVATFLGGITDGARDGSLFRCDDCGSFWNGKQSWTRKYRNGDIRQGEAYFGSTSVLAWTTDAPHLMNMFSHQFQSFALVLSPGVQGSLGKKLLYAVGYNVVRQMGQSFAYNAFFKQKIQ